MISAEAFRFVTLTGIVACISSLCFADNLSLRLIGNVKTICALNLDAGNQIDFSREKQKELAVNVYCNRPLELSISSLNGGLKNQGYENIPVAPYLLDLNFSDAGIQFSAKSQDLKQTMKIPDSGVIPFSVKGKLRVTLEKRLLFAGQYEDTVFVDIYPSLNSASPP